MVEGLIGDVIIDPSGGNWLVIDDIGGNTVLVWFEWYLLFVEVVVVLLFIIE